MNKITGILLFIGALPLPGEYYDLLRVVVSIMAVTHILKGSYVFIPILILFNPIMPVYLYSKPLWVIIDIISGFVFMAASEEE